MRRFVALAAGVLLLAGCSSPVAEKSGTGELRSDLEPLTARFELLADAPSAVWASGTYGDGRAPGPSTYWIDAVVTLDDATEAQLRALDLEASETPSLTEPVTAPDGTWLSDDALDELFSPAGYVTDAWLSADEPLLILQSTFE